MYVCGVTSFLRPLAAFIKRRKVLHNRVKQEQFQEDRGTNEKCFIDWIFDIQKKNVLLSTINTIPGP